MRRKLKFLERSHFWDFPHFQCDASHVRLVPGTYFSMAEEGETGRVPNEIISKFFSFLDFVSHIRFAATCRRIRQAGLAHMPRDAKFEEDKAAFILARATSRLVWPDAQWMKIENFGRLYEKFFFSFERTGQKIEEFLLAHPTHFEVYAGCRIYNTALFGPPPDK